MITIPLETSEQIEQPCIEEEGPPKIRGWCWVLMACQWYLVMAASVVVLESLQPTSQPGRVLLSFSLLCLVCGVVWLMHQRRRAFVWLFMVQEFVLFGLISLRAQHDSDIIGTGIAAVLFVAYVLLSRRVRETFYRTLGEPTR